MKNKGYISIAGNCSNEGPGHSDDESCLETGSYHSTCSEERHDLDYLARKKGKLFLEIDRWPAFSRFL